MSRTIHDQTLALAGVFQAAALVQQIAHQGQCSPSTYETCVRSLFATNPESTLEVFGELKDLREGLNALANGLTEQNKKLDIEVLRYGLNLIQLESKLNKRSDMLDILSSRIDQARHTAGHFGYGHSNLTSNLASVYTDTISTFKLRIQVTGDPNQLRVEENAAKVRTLLLAGIRSAVLWRQTGGRRWNLIFNRKKIIETAHALAEQANQSVYD
ncbi:high frequency lysogenization protein HflD [Marinobacter caseinilyticus]|uniref:high frequency lysogenization protein HflD n=1 Tax=Marinobacter caseinilyticus TaxID=2692195 RepID=UPI001407C0D2|nr:high frequency lysogenization protein HflD [Marinobacter caseinilyticus]